MIRSFALTFGAVALRLYLPILRCWGCPFLDGCRLTSFLAWIPNLIVAEFYLQGVSAQPAPPSAIRARPDRDHPRSARPILRCAVSFRLTMLPRPCRHRDSGGYGVAGLNNRGVISNLWLGQTLITPP